MSFLLDVFFFSLVENLLMMTCNLKEIYTRVFIPKDFYTTRGEKKTNTLMK